MNPVLTRDARARRPTFRGSSARNTKQKLRKLHVELVKLQEWVKREGKKVCVVFEGRDGAGKGGVIKAMTERVRPRVFRVVAIWPPRRNARSRKCMFSDTCRIFLPGARS